jgi:hypothetical protein
MRCLARSGRNWDLHKRYSKQELILKWMNRGMVLKLKVEVCLFEVHRTGLFEIISWIVPKATRTPATILRCRLLRNGSQSDHATETTAKGMPVEVFSCQESKFNPAVDVSQLVSDILEDTGARFFRRRFDTDPVALEPCFAIS